jgi:hypothetical protein
MVIHRIFPAHSATPQALSASQAASPPGTAFVDAGNVRLARLIQEREFVGPQIRVETAPRSDRCQTWRGLDDECVNPVRMRYRHPKADWTDRHITVPPG